jgi:hypothetical protein
LVGNLHDGHNIIGASRLDDADWVEVAGLARSIGSRCGKALWVGEHGFA